MSFLFLFVSVKSIKVGSWESISLLRTDPLASLAWGSPPILHWMRVMSVDILLDFTGQPWHSGIKTGFAGSLWKARGGGTPILEAPPEWDRGCQTRAPLSSKTWAKPPSSGARLAYMDIFSNRKELMGQPINQPQFGPMKKVTHSFQAHLRIWKKLLVF